MHDLTTRLSFYPLNINNSNSAASTSSEPDNSQQRQLIPKVLSQALRLWLRSQVQQVSDLEVKISGSDRQILAGKIPHVLISATQAVYQGMHLGKIHLVGANIRVNLGQVLRGQPLRLLEPVPISGELLLQESDFNASFDSPMLATALTDFLLTLLESDSSCAALSLREQQLNWQDAQIKIESEQITLSATLTSNTGLSTPLNIRTGLQLASSHELQLSHTEVETQQGFLLKSQGSLIDLGSEVAIDELKLSPGQLICRGRINIIPAN